MEIDENNQLLINGEEQKDNQENTNEINFADNNLGNSVIIGINDKARNTIYAVLVLISAFSSCDGGIIPQQNSKIKEDFKDNDNALVGFFGSVDYIGRVIGAIVFSFILGKVNRKFVLFITLILKAITLLISLLFKGAIINIIFRGISGISQVFYTSYLPVWCDQYGKKKESNINGNANSIRESSWDNFRLRNRNGMRKNVTWCFPWLETWFWDRRNNFTHMCYYHNIFQKTIFF